MANILQANRLLISGQVVTAVANNLLVNGISVGGGGTNLNGLITTGSADLRYLQTGSSGQFYLASNPNQFAKSGQFISGISVTGGVAIQGAVNFVGLYGTQVIQSGSNTIGISGGAGGGGATTINNFSINSGTGLYIYRSGITSGVAAQFITYPSILDTRPIVIATLHNDNDDNILGYQVSGANPTGFWAIFSDVVSHTGYYLDIMASNSSTTGMATIVINNTSQGGAGVGVYRNFWVDAGAMSPTFVSGASTSSFTFTGTDWLSTDCYAFNDQTGQFINFKMMMPDEWDKGSLKAKFNWVPATGLGTVAWEIAAGAIADSGVFGAILGNPVLTIDNGFNSGRLHLSSGSPSFTVGGSPTTGMMTLFRIGRRAADANDIMSGDAKLLGVGIQYLETTTNPVSW